MSEIVPAEAEVVLEQGSRFGGIVAVLVGIVAVTAALTAMLEADSSRREDDASTRASRLATVISARTATSSAHFTFRQLSLQDATSLGLEGTFKQLAIFKHPGARDVEGPLAVAQVTASKRIAAIGEKMSELPSAADGVDPTARAAVAATVPQLQALVKEQNAAVEASNRYGGRGQLGILGLTLVAIAAALLGLAGVVGMGPPGRLLLAAAVAAWAGALAAGATALAL